MTLVLDNIPFIPNTVAVLKHNDNLFSVFESSAKTFGNTNPQNTDPIISKQRIGNAPGTIIVKEPHRTLLIEGIFTKTLPIPQNLSYFLERYLTTHKRQFYKNFGPNQDWIPSTQMDNRVGLLDLGILHSGSAIQTMKKQFQLDFRHPVQHARIVELRQDYLHQNEEQIEE